MSKSAPEPDPLAEEAATAADVDPDEPQFINRAARRAKGKSAGKTQAIEKGKAPIGRGSVQSPRQYGTRRSG